MTSDEARERFDAAFEGELEAEARAAFDAALAADAALADDYAAFVATMRAVRGVGLDAPEPSSEPLLEAVHQQLRLRSRGRFYRDRFASVRGAELVLPFVLAAVVFVLCVVAVVGRRVVVVEPVAPRAPNAPDPRGPSDAP